MGKKTLFMAAGHGGNDRGNVTTGIVERDELIRIAGGMQMWYSMMGIRPQLGGCVFLNDDLDLTGELAALKAWKLREADGDLAVNLHLDYNAARPQGGALMIYDESPTAQRAAEVVLARWCAATGIVNNGVHRSIEVARRWRNFDDFGFCRPSEYGGLIFELGSLNSKHDMQIVRNPVYQALAAQLLWEAWYE